MDILDNSFRNLNKIEGLDNLVNLKYLNLCDNPIKNFNFKKINIICTINIDYGNCERLLKMIRKNKINKIIKLMRLNLMFSLFEDILCYDIIRIISFYL